jgi:hypothetical protein
MFVRNNKEVFLIMADTYYCVKCKKKQELKDAQRITMKNGKPALRGQCSVCGTTVNAILGSEKSEKQA